MVNSPLRPDTQYDTSHCATPTATERLVRGPEDALAVLTFRTLWNRGIAFERELLQTGTLIGFRGVNIAL